MYNHSMQLEMTTGAIHTFHIMSSTNIDIWNIYTHSLAYVYSPTSSISLTEISGVDPKRTIATTTIAPSMDNVDINR